MSFSIFYNYFSYPSFLAFNPTVSTNFTCVNFWYSWFTSFHFLFKPSLISFTYSSDKHGIFASFSCRRVCITLYSYSILSFILFKYSGFFPYSFFFNQFFSSLPFLEIDKIFSTAFETIKFLFDFSPWIGLSRTVGTGYFLCLQS